MIKEIYLAGGCFWGVEHYMKQIRGVVFTETGFANGNTANPSYKEVYTDTTGFAETVHVKYDSKVITTGRLIEIFSKAIDATSVNKQGEDAGTRYRTGIYYTEMNDFLAIKRAYNRIKRENGGQIAVELCPLRNFYKAEDYHQDYLENNPTGYCHLSKDLFEYARKANRQTSKITRHNL